MNKVIFIGDSYAARTNNWITLLANKLGLSTDDYYVSALGSTGFVHESQGKTFLTLLQDVIPSIQDLSEITHVIVCGGANDTYHEVDEIKNAISNFLTYVANTLPSAYTLIGQIAYTTDATKLHLFGQVTEAYSGCARFGNARYLSNVEYILHNRSLIESDGVHPTVEGCVYLSCGIYEAITTGSCNVIYGQRRFNQVISSATTQPLYETLNNNIVELYSNTRWGINFPSPLTITCDGVTRIGLGYLDSNYITGNHYETARVSTSILIYDGSYHEVAATIGVYDHKLELYPLHSVNNQFKQFNNVTNIIIPQFKIVSNSLIQ